MQKRRLLELSFVVFLDMFVAIGMSMVTLPFFLQSFGASAAAMGIALMLFSAMQFVMIPFWGSLSDRLGRRKVMMLQQAGAAVGMLVVATAPSVALVYVGRAIGGVFGGTFMLSTAYVSDIAPEEDRTHAMGIIVIALAVGGFMVGPAVGGAIAHFGLRTPFLVGAAVALVNVLFLFALVREPETHTPTALSLSRESLAAALADPRTRGAIFLNVLSFGGMAAFQTCFPFFMGARFGLKAEQVGPLLAIFGVTGIIGQGFVVGRLGRRFGEARVVLVSGLLAAIAVSGVPAAAAMPHVVVALVAFGFLQSTLLPSLMSLASLGAPRDLRGTAMGAFYAMQSLVLVVAPPLYGQIYDRVGIRVPFWIAAGLFGVVGLTAIMWPWARRNASATPG